MVKVTDADRLIRLEHESVMASVALGKWLSAALDDDGVCEEMKADIRRWFSAGHIYYADILAELARHRIAGAKAALKKAARWVQDNYPHDKRVIVPAIRNIDPEECE